MSTKVDPPRSDDLLERHQFYAAVSAELATLEDKDARHHESIGRVHARLDETHKTEEATREQLITTETRNRTLAASVVFILTAISGTFGWIFDKSATKIEQFATKFEQMEKTYQTQKHELERLVELRETVSRLDRSVRNLEKVAETNHPITPVANQSTNQQTFKVPTK